MDPETELAREEAALAPWAAAYAAFYGARPELHRGLGAHPTLVLRYEDDRFGLSRRMLGTLARFAGRPRLLGHLRALGFEGDARGALHVLPTPASLRRRVEELGFTGVGFEPELVAIDGLELPAGAWLARHLDAASPLNVGTVGLYERALRGGLLSRLGPRRERALVHHLLALPHDLTKHVLVTHLAPRARLVELGATARAALSPLGRWLADAPSTRAPRVLGRVPKGWLAPVPLLTFYENDLVDYCHAVWGAIERPEQFAPTFSRRPHFAQLLDVLARRVAQSAGWIVRRRDAPPRPYARFVIDRAASPTDGA